MQYESCMIKKNLVTKQFRCTERTDLIKTSKTVFGHLSNLRNAPNKNWMNNNGHFCENHLLLQHCRKSSGAEIGSKKSKMQKR